MLKGTETIIAAPDGSTFRNTAGNPGLATAGSVTSGLAYSRGLLRAAPLLRKPPSGACTSTPKPELLSIVRGKAGRFPARGADVERWPL